MRYEEDCLIGTLPILLTNFIIKTSCLKCGKIKKLRAKSAVSLYFGLFVGHNHDIIFNVFFFSEVDPSSLSNGSKQRAIRAIVVANIPAMTIASIIFQNICKENADFKNQNSESRVFHNILNQNKIKYSRNIFRINPLSSKKKTNF